MSNECCSNESCSTQNASSSSQCCESGSKCPCGGECGGDPAACAKALWCSSFASAMRQAHVDALKVRIVKAFGSKIDAGADAVVEAMGAIWASKMAGAKAKNDLAAKMAGIMFGK